MDEKRRRDDERRYLRIGLGLLGVGFIGLVVSAVLGISDNDGNYATVVAVYSAVFGLLFGALTLSRWWTGAWLQD